MQPGALQETEYSSLRFEQRNRYDLANKLNSGFITFTTAVLTIGISLLVLDNNIISDYVTSQQNYPKTYAAGLLLIEFFVSILFMLPILYSKICFNHSLENSIRISLITDYLDCSVSKLQQKNWDNMRRNHGILPYFYGSFGAPAPDRRVGDLSNMHRIISWTGFIVGAIYGGSIYFSCIINNPFGSATSTGDNRLWKYAGGFYLLLIVLSLLSHFRILHRKSWKYEKMICATLPSPKIYPLKSMKHKYEERNAIYIKWKKRNTKYMIIAYGALALSVIVLLVLRGFFNNGSGDATIDTYRTIVPAIYIGVMLLCIWQWPLYGLECNIADIRIYMNQAVTKDYWK